MSDTAVVGRPPRARGSGASGTEFRALRRGNCVVVSLPDLADSAVGLGLLEPGGLARWVAGGAPGPRGRTRTARIALGPTRELHVRPAVHGGILGPLWCGRVLGLGRAIAELRVATRLSAAGAPVVRPALVAAERRSGLWRAAVATWFEPDAIDAERYLASDPAPARTLRAAAAAGTALRRFHDAGGRHADLHAGNLLLREGAAGCEAWLVDLDRARDGAPPGAQGRLAEIMRLYRSLSKRGLLGRLGRRGCAVFLAAYTGSDRDLRRALVRHLPRERRRLALHRLGWRLVGSRKAAGGDRRVRGPRG